MRGLRTRSGRPVMLMLTGVLALVLAACGGDGDGEGDDGAADGGAATEVTFEGSDELAFDPEAATVAAAEEVTVNLECGPSIEHTFLIEGVEGDAVIAECAADGTGNGTVTLEAGEYRFYCNIPGHAEAGMEGTLTAS